MGTDVSAQVLSRTFGTNMIKIDGPKLILAQL